MDEVINTENEFIALIEADCWAVTVAKNKIHRVLYNQRGLDIAPVAVRTPERERLYDGRVLKRYFKRGYDVTIHMFAHKGWHAFGTHDVSGAFKCECADDV